jgi:hypothetical protein
MNPNDLSQNPGAELAHNALADALAKAQSYCTHETERIALQTRSRIAALHAELARLQEEEQRIQGRLHRALPAGDAKDRRRKATYYWVVTSALTVAGFFFSLLAFDPYRLGWKSYLYCAGIALIAPFCVEKFLETWSSPKLIKFLASVACIAAVTSLVLLSLVRGDLLTQQFKAAAPIVILSGDAPAPPPQTDFYQKTVCLLRAVMALLALSMEIGAGLALYEARRHSVSAGEDASRVGQELAAIQQRMVAKLEELRNAENAAAIFQNRFWRDFYRALSDGLSHSALVKVSMVLLFLALLIAPRARAAEKNLVIALDLTRSVAVGAPGQRQEFEKNVEAAAEVLARVPANAHATIIGITDQSFGEPLTLLDARIPEDEGYFQERITAVRRTLIQAWIARTRGLQPQFMHTDIFGALLLASQIFQSSLKGRNLLVVFSDMRENAGDVNFEKPKGNVHLSPARLAKGRPIPQLQNVEVYVLGADNAGKSIAYWTALRDFWSEYLQSAGATLKAYTVLREPPQLAPVHEGK